MFGTLRYEYLLKVITAADGFHKRSETSSCDTCFVAVTSVNCNINKANDNSK